jgi:hypothetical protein
MHRRAQLHEWLPGLRHLLVFLVGAITSGCSILSPSDVEHHYSYREVGLCNGVYVGESHTPARKIDHCLELLTTAVTLNISASSQTVTLIEEDLKLNTDNELKTTSATRLHDCKVVDHQNFNCSGLVRSGGEFVDTSAVGDRRLSQSIVASSLARYTNGWISATTLKFNESIWSALLYWIVAAPICLVLLLLVASALSS